MTRPNCTLVILVLLFRPFLLCSVSSDENSPFQRVQLTENIYVLTGEGANVAFFTGPDSVLVVDSHYRQLGKILIKEIQSVTPEQIRYLINTHYHGDHVGGNEAFQEAGAVIIGHFNCRKGVLSLPGDILSNYPQIVKELRDSGDEKRAYALEQEIEWARTVKPEEIPAPVLLFHTEMQIHLGNETIHLWHPVAAHTDGDVVVYFEKNKVLHMGDLFTDRIVPFIDVSMGGSIFGYIDAIQEILDRVSVDTIVIPGHGKVASLSALKEYRQYFVDVKRSAEQARATGTKKSQFIREITLPAYKDWKNYDPGLREHAALAYDELESK